jgi:hypothetical protein
VIAGLSSKPYLYVGGGTVPACQRACGPSRTATCSRVMMSLLQKTGVEGRVLYVATM